jgi:hypothetical protein
MYAYITTLYIQPYRAMYAYITTLYIQPHRVMCAYITTLNSSSYNHVQG